MKSRLKDVKNVFSGDEVDDQVLVQGPCTTLLCCVTQMGGKGEKEEGRGGRKR